MKIAKEIHFEKTHESTQFIVEKCFAHNIFKLKILFILLKFTQEIYDILFQSHKLKIKTPSKLFCVPKKKNRTEKIMMALVVCDGQNVSFILLFITLTVNHSCLAHAFGIFTFTPTWYHLIWLHCGHSESRKKSINAGNERIAVQISNYVAVQNRLAGLGEKNGREKKTSWLVHCSWFEID